MKKILFSLALAMILFSWFLLHADYKKNAELDKINTFKNKIETHAKYLAERKNFFQEWEFAQDDEYEDLNDYKWKTIGKFNENNLWSCGVSQKYYDIYFNKLDSETSNQLVENCFEESVNPSHINWYN